MQLIGSIPAGEVMEELRRRASHAPLVAAIEGGSKGKWDALRKLYAFHLPGIEKRHPGPYSPYFVDWGKVFTPIESLAWNAIRGLGLPFYPQFPVGRFFVDFADPVFRIAVECDGKQWHDSEKDAKRDEEIRSDGWTVCRFTGRQCVLPEDHYESIDQFFRQLGRTIYKRHSWDEEGECLASEQ